MVLDGVVDAADYADAGWSTNLDDVEKISAEFAAACVRASPELCPIASWSPSGNASELLASFLASLENLKENPVADIVDGVPVFASYYDITQLIFALWYSPYKGFRLVASLMKALSENDLSWLVAAKPPFSCDHPSLVSLDHSAAAQGILCTDGPSQVNETKEEFRDYVDWCRAQSPTFGESWSTIRMACHGYNVRAKWRFAGPFGAEETKVGILFASQSLDPVTPLRNAVKASGLFPRSRVLEVMGSGHCTLGWPSVCAAREIRGYFRDGRVEEDRVLCPVSVEPFGSREEEGERERLDAAEDGEDGELEMVLKGIGDAWPPEGMVGSRYGL